MRCYFTAASLPFSAPIKQCLSYEEAETAQFAKWKTLIYGRSLSNFKQCTLSLLGPVVTSSWWWCHSIVLSSPLFWNPNGQEVAPLDWEPICPAASDSKTTGLLLQGLVDPKILALKISDGTHLPESNKNYFLPNFPLLLCCMCKHTGNKTRGPLKPQAFVGIMCFYSCCNHHLHLFSDQKSIFPAPFGGFRFY